MSRKFSSKIQNVLKKHSVKCILYSRKFSINLRNAIFGVPLNDYFCFRLAFGQNKTNNGFNNKFLEIETGT